MGQIKIQSKEIKNTRGFLTLDSPTEEDLKSEIFNAIFDVIKHWDIGIDGNKYGYSSGNGSHAKLILDKLKPVLRQEKIDKIIGDGE